MQLVARLLLRRLRFDIRLVHVVSVGDKVTLRQGILKHYVIRKFSLFIVQPLFHNHFSLQLIKICNQQHIKKTQFLAKIYFNLPVFNV